MLTRTDIDGVCVALQELQVFRKYQIKQEISAINRATGLVARYCGFDSGSEELTRRRDGSDSEEEIVAKKKARGKIFNRAEGILKLAWNHQIKKDDDAFRIVWKPKPQETTEDAAIYTRLEADLIPTFHSLQPVLLRRAQIENEMDERTEASFAPLKSFIEGMAGFSWRGLAVIIGEAGNLSNYPGIFPEGHPRAGERRPLRHGYSCLNARFGLHLIEGFEHKALSTFRKYGGLGLSQKETKEFWNAAGYNPSRLGQLVGVVGTPLLNAKAKNKYGTMWTARRAHTLITHPEWHFDKHGKMKPINEKTGFPPSEHAMMDANRICLKEFLEDLLREWRRVIVQINYEESSGED